MKQITDKTIIPVLYKERKGTNTQTIKKQFTFNLWNKITKLNKWDHPSLLRR